MTPNAKIRPVLKRKLNSLFKTGLIFAFGVIKKETPTTLYFGFCCGKCAQIKRADKENHTKWRMLLRYF